MNATKQVVLHRKLLSCIHFKPDLRQTMFKGTTQHLNRNLLSCTNFKPMQC